jgi:hypothetical protein
MTLTGKQIAVRRKTIQQELRSAVRRQEKLDLKIARLLHELEELRRQEEALCEPDDGS